MALPASAETVRIATFNTELARKGPGLLLRDILKGEADVASAQAAINAVNPDILAVQSFDYDLTGAALKAFSDGLARPYAHHFARVPNTGLSTGLDLNDDRRLGTEKDAQGYGAFHGQGGMAVLSRYPFEQGGVVDHSDVLWSSLEAGLWDGPDVLTEAARDVQRLSTTAHWEVPVTVGGTVLTLLTYHATPPVFDGPEDRNGRRNADETLFWLPRLSAVETPVLLGDANLDPARGDGRSEAMQRLLAHPALQDPLPGTDSVVFEQTGPLRVDYVLPAASLTITDAGIHWPEGDDASRHALIWVDIALP
ncbi:endonuclease/exonuclease/phosphatase family protein [Cognatishimia sp. MH4019]|uniref:endonuclease/exonuclease/phosphatase family protein n=1 Tax=Cognatishimia sp. MH4019 TaxID=2854030 RepID=UPI001CD81971|nr:endonuclease/exonuclease/phosphatase family protein [Cognatishimia sp. MH4019]